MHKVMLVILIIPFLLRVVTLAFINYLRGTTGTSDEFTYKTSFFSLDVYPNQTNFESYHVVYLFNGLGNFFTDYVTNYCMELICTLILFNYFPTRYGIPIRFKVYHADAILQQIIDTYNTEIPKNYKQTGNIFENIFEQIRGLAVFHAAVSTTTHYGQSLTEDFSKTVIADNPKSFSIIGFSQGGINGSIIIDYLGRNKTNPSFINVTPKFRNMITVDSPLNIYTQFDLTLLTTVKKYQIISIYDQLSFYPDNTFDATIPISSIQITVSHLDILVASELMEYLVYIMLYSQPEIWNQLPSYFTDLSYFKKLNPNLPIY
jgi:hypothetical protein